MILSKLAEGHLLKKGLNTFQKYGKTYGLIEFHLFMGINLMETHMFLAPRFRETHRNR